MEKDPAAERNQVVEESSHNRFGDVKTSAVWGTIACGAGLFSDGYLNAVSGFAGEEDQMPDLTV